MRHMIWLAVVLGVIGSMVLATAIATTPTVDVVPGERFTAHCETEFSGVTQTAQEIAADCLPHPATATPEPTATETVEPTATATLEPTVTPEPTATATATPPVYSTWHAATNHEHGDAPPQWADDWSQQQFGHPVIFGGDEATPGENHHKHEAYKGYAWRVRADNGTYVDVYLRVHLASNPMDRSVRYHSYEMYARDASGAVSFWQGWLDFGDAPSARDTFANNYLRYIIPKYDPSNHVTGWAQGTNRYYISTYSGREFWYAQQSTPGGWDPVIIIDIYDPTTYTVAGEEATAFDTATWKPTGWKGVDRRVTLRWIFGGSSVETASGYPYLTRNMDNPRGWFCATPTGDITATGAAVCDAGSLPQHIATTMPAIGKTEANGARYRKTQSCTACVLPN